MSTHDQSNTHTNALVCHFLRSIVQTLSTDSSADASFRLCRHIDVASPLSRSPSPTSFCRCIALIIYALCAISGIIGSTSQWALWASSFFSTFDPFFSKKTSDCKAEVLFFSFSAFLLVFIVMAVLFHYIFWKIARWCLFIASLLR